MLKIKKYPKSRQSNLVVQDFEKEILIYDLKVNKAFCLNETSALVWQLCDGKNSVADLRVKLGQKLQTPVPEEIIWLALDTLKKSDLLENEKFEINFSGMNRRQVIRKVGLTSMILLPLISSIFAPTASMAQSGGGGGGGGAAAAGGSCSTNANCASNTCLSVNGTLTCCAAGTNSLNANPPGNTLGGCIASGACAGPSNTKDCCSGMTTFTPNIVCPAGQGRCDCAPY